MKTAVSSCELATDATHLLYLFLANTVAGPKVLPRLSLQDSSRYAHQFFNGRGTTLWSHVLNFISGRLRTCHNLTRKNCELLAYFHRRFTNLIPPSQTGIWLGCEVKGVHLLLQPFSRHLLLSLPFRHTNTVTRAHGPPLNYLRDVQAHDRQSPCLFALLLSLSSMKPKAAGPSLSDNSAQHAGSSGETSKGSATPKGSTKPKKGKPAKSKYQVGPTPYKLKHVPSVVFPQIAHL